MQRHWYEKAVINLAKNVALIFGGTILGAFVGYSVILAVKEHGMAIISILLLGIGMLWVGAWINTMTDREESEQETL